MRAELLRRCAKKKLVSIAVPAALSPFTPSITSRATSSPIVWPEGRMVLRGGLQEALKLRSPKPTTAICSGTANTAALAFEEHAECVKIVAADQPVDARKLLQRAAEQQRSRIRRRGARDDG